jgi:hypothetical protein
MWQSILSIATREGTATVPVVPGQRINSAYLARALVMRGRSSARPGVS